MWQEGVWYQGGEGVSSPPPLIKAHVRVFVFEYRVYTISNKTKKMSLNVFRIITKDIIP